MPVLGSVVSVALASSVECILEAGGEMSLLKGCARALSHGRDAPKQLGASFLRNQLSRERGSAMRPAFHWLFTPSVNLGSWCTGRESEERPQKKRGCVPRGWRGLPGSLALPFVEVDPGGICFCGRRVAELAKGSLAWLGTGT